MKVKYECNFYVIFLSATVFYILRATTSIFLKIAATDINIMYKYFMVIDRQFYISSIF